MPSACKLCLCWVRAASGHFLGEVGLRWVFVNGLEWVQKWVKSGFLGAKVGKNGPKPTFAPTLNPFRDFPENPLFTQFKGGGNCFLKTALRQSRPSIKLCCVPPSSPENFCEFLFGLASKACSERMAAISGAFPMVCLSQ